MDLQLSEEQTSCCRKASAEFAEAEVRPLAKELDETGNFPREIFAKAAELGLTGIALPEEEGGAGFDHVAYTIVIEEISRCCASTGVILSVQNSLYCDPIHRFGTGEQKEKFLLPFARGEKIGCYALTEPQAGSNAAALQTKAVRKGDTYVVNGTKAWITNGGAADAAHCVCEYRSSRRARKASRRWWLKKAHRDFAWAKKKRNWESARRLAANWFFRIAKCPRRIASGTKAKATK